VDKERLKLVDTAIMAPVTCNACNKEFEDEVEQKEHYRSEWHRYNLKRKVLLGYFSLYNFLTFVRRFYFLVFLIFQSFSRRVQTSSVLMVIRVA
jgi:Zinc-finger double-stranded RNA-binding